MARISLAIVCATLACAQARAADFKSPPVSNYAVTAFGARGDGATNDTALVQRAIEACAAHGGGTVYFAPGVYLCGSLHLRSGVVLWLDAGATIKGSERRDDYDRYETLGFKNASDHETSYFHYALIWGEDVEHIGIVGQGTIDANRRKRGGPKPIALKRCKHVAIQGITIENAPNYNISLLGTDEVVIDGVTIRNGYCDGIDPDCCHNVRIANCTIASVDDAIVPKTSLTLGRVRSTENVTVTNCVLATEANGLKLGTESRGDFKRIAFSNCVVTGLRDHPATSGVSLESVDGANVDGVVVSNITMVDCRAPIFLRLGNRGRDMQKPTPGTLRNVCLSNIVATRGTICASMTGIPGHPVQNVTCSNLQFSYAGGIRYCPPDAAIPEQIQEYPDADQYEALPSYGLYCRHVEGLTLSNVHVRFDDGFYRIQARHDRNIRWAADSAAQPSAPARPGLALLCDDVKDLTIAGFRGRPSADEPSLLRLVNVRSAMVTGCIAPDGANRFLELAGANTSRVSVVGNDFRGAAEAVAVLGANPKELVCLGNADGRSAATAKDGKK
jgi:hypothetical protein